MYTEIGIFDELYKTLDKLNGNGILLVAGDPPNPMTIGWATFGTIWHLNILTVLVRPTRFTFRILKEADSFSLCILPDHLYKEIALCGSQTGRDLDKMYACGFHTVSCSRVKSYFIRESELHYECRIVHHHRLDPSTLDPKIDKRFYPGKDHHTVWYGEIMGVFRHTDD